MSDQQLLQLLEKYLDNTCTEEERTLVEQWYEIHESRHAPGHPPSAPLLASIYQDMVERMQQEQVWVEESRPRIRRMPKGWWAAAAAVVLVVSVGLGWLFLRDGSMLTLQTPNGEHTSATLPDGTKVWLNVGSTLRYPVGMKDGSREIQLDGEAYFEVAASPEHPFVIHTEKVRVQVLGTSFNLKAYREDASLETTLIDGKLAVELMGAPRYRQVLAPGQKLLLTQRAPGQPVASSDWDEYAVQLQSAQPAGQEADYDETMWRKDRLRFRDKSFTELARMMERWFDRRIVLVDTSLNENRFAGEFRKEDIREALKALQLTTDFQFEIKGDTVFIGL
ncbi:FecR family protein [Chitinophaga lutea]